jgi:hypothetical protein
MTMYGARLVAEMASLILVLFLILVGLIVHISSFFLIVNLFHLFRVATTLAVDRDRAVWSRPPA